MLSNPCSGLRQAEALGVEPPPLSFGVEPAKGAGTHPTFELLTTHFFVIRSCFGSDSQQQVGRQAKAGAPAPDRCTPADFGMPVSYM
mmetsp:Transcript_30459/g.59766  ORF Transcript_30459/g.59766 Transcript_30459/m.59766 type:complete len:87 (+) Transcript_30459:21-281(+)